MVNKSYVKLDNTDTDWIQNLPKEYLQMTIEFQQWFFLYNQYTKKDFLYSHPKVFKEILKMITEIIEMCTYPRLVISRSCPMEQNKIYQILPHTLIDIFSEFLYEV